MQTQPLCPATVASYYALTSGVVASFDDDQAASRAPNLTDIAHHQSQPEAT